MQKRVSDGEPEKISKEEQQRIRRNDTMEKIRLDYAIRWLDLHCKQRITMFYYSIIIVTGLLAACGALLNKTPMNSKSLLIVLLIAGILLCVIFWIIDYRNKKLVDLSWNELERIENQWLFRNDQAASEEFDCVTVKGLVRIDRTPSEQLKYQEQTLSFTSSRKKTQSWKASKLTHTKAIKYAYIIFIGAFLLLITLLLLIF